MKKNFIISLLFVIISAGSLSAQYYYEDEAIRDRFRLGLRAGINSSTIYDTEGQDFSGTAKTGFVGGLFLSIPLGRFVGLQPELLYSQKGFKGTGTILIADYNYTRRTDYIDIPLQLQIKPIRFVTLVVGPQYSFLINKGFTFNSGSITIDQQKNIEDINLRKNTLGVVGGLDINIERLVISGRVAWDLQDNNGDGTSTSPRYRNMIAQVTLGVLL